MEIGWSVGGGKLIEQCCRSGSRNSAAWLSNNSNNGRHSSLTHPTRFYYYSCRSGSRSSSYSLQQVGEALRLAFNGTAALPTGDANELAGLPPGQRQALAGLPPLPPKVPPQADKYKVHVHLEKSKVGIGWCLFVLDWVGLGGVSGGRIQGGRAPGKSQARFCPLFWAQKGEPQFDRLVCLLVRLLVRLPPGS